MAKAAPPKSPGGPVVPEAPDAGDRPTPQDVVGRDAYARYKRTLDGLDEPERTAVVGRIEHGHEWVDVGRALGGVSEDQARTTVCRAILELAGTTPAAVVEGTPLSALALAVAERASVDWDGELRRAADEGEREVVRQIHVIDELARFCARPGSQPARTLSHDRRRYQILGKLGAGGMGIVYRAEDLTLKRSVALKVITGALHEDEHSRSRFLREARTAASLNHPNVCSIYDFGEVQPGEEEFLGGGERLEAGTPFISMELIEGRTLVALLGEHRPIRFSKMIDIAIQVAGGLAAAHVKGVVHRDLKPGNVMVSPDGKVKILDFGLAKPVAALTADNVGTSTTKSAQKALTTAGKIVGTVAYMSPEQAMGLPLDSRSDVFSFGTMLYEMATGKHPFAGESPVSTLGKILEAEPESLANSVPAAPPELDQIARRCLRKRPDERYNDTRDLVIALEELRQRTTSGAQSAAMRRLGARRGVWTAAVAGLVVGAFGAGVMLERGARLSSRAVSAPDTIFQRLTTFDGVEYWPTLSPDGRTVAYEKAAGGERDVFFLRVGGANPTNLTASIHGDCGEPAFSPDGRFIAFRSESERGGVFVMGATGESPRRVTDFGHNPSWFPDGKRLAISTEQSDPGGIMTASEIWIVDLESGARHKVEIAGSNLQPSVSPHGLRIAYFGVHPGQGQRDIFTVGIGDPATVSSTHVTDDLALDWSPFWSGDGRLLYFASNRNGTMNLWRVGIDEASGKVHGDPEPVTVPVSRAGPFRGTPDGSNIVFASVELESILERVPFDPANEEVSGVPAPLVRLVNDIELPRVSPQGDALTFTELGSKEHIQVLKTDGTELRTLTDDHYHNRGPNFSPDGKKVVFFSDRSGIYDAWIVDVDGSGLAPVTRSAAGNMLQRPIWSPDGKTIAVGDSFNLNLRLLPFPRSVDDSLPELCPPPGERLGFFPHSWSPDSKTLAGWIVRTDGSRGGIALYDVATKTYRRVTETGYNPTFLRDGRRIAFRDGDVLKIVDIATARTREILQGDARGGLESFGLAPDDKTLFVVRGTTQADLWLMRLGGKR